MIKFVEENTGKEHKPDPEKAKEEKQVDEGSLNSGGDGKINK